MTNKIKPIRSDTDHAEAMAEIKRLWGAAPETPEGDRLDVLLTLVDAYEAHRYPIDPPDPIEVIKFRMEQQGLSAKDLQAILGTRTRVADVLKGETELTLAMSKRLRAALGISADVLIGQGGK